MFLGRDQSVDNCGFMHYRWVLTISCRSYGAGLGWAGLITINMALLTELARAWVVLIAVNMALLRSLALQGGCSLL